MTPINFGSNSIHSLYPPPPLSSLTLVLPSSMEAKTLMRNKMFFPVRHYSQKKEVKSRI